MRSCIYCGRELEKGEACTCPQSVLHRQNKTTSEQKQGNYQNPFKTETSYKTGYAEKNSRFERAKAKREAKRAARKSAAKNVNPKGFFMSFWNYVLGFLKSPVERISNPGHIGKCGMLTIAAIQGALLWLCMFFVLRGGGVGPFKLLASVMSFNGIAGYNLLAQIGLSILSGAVSGVVIFFVYSGIFYLINRFIMRLRTAYWDFCVRLVSAWIPFTAICAVGAVLSILSPLTLLALLMCGAVTVVVLTYEALKTEWISYPPTKVMYALMLGYFVFFSVMSHLILM